MKEPPFSIELPPTTELEEARSASDPGRYAFIMFRDDRCCIGGTPVTEGFDLSSPGTAIGDVEYTARIFEVQCYGVYNLVTGEHKLVAAFGEVTEYVKWIWQLAVDRTELIKRKASPEEFAELEQRLMLGGPRSVPPAEAQ